MSCPRCNAPALDETLREFGGVCPKCLLDFSEEQDAPAFPNLEIVEMLGQGGMGVVYKAVQKNLGRTVALKVLSPQLSDDPEFVERFTREARALASLSHPNIVGIYDSGIHDHVPYLVMEYVDGTPLRKMLALKKLTPERVLEVIPQICDALHYAHEHGVVHRDIKPENILVDREGRVKIADFGLAKLASIEETRITRTGYVMGSPRYMAPEQFENSGRVDHRADIYSLGVVFYEMLTGEVPMGRFKPPSEKAPVDQRLDPVVLKSLEREPDDRWQTADEVKERVTRLDGVPVRPKSGSRWKKILIAVVAVLALQTICGLLALVYVGMSVSSPGETREPSAAWKLGRFPIVLLGVGIGIGALVLWNRSKRIDKPLAPVAQRSLERASGDRNTKIAIGVIAAIAVMAICASLWLSRRGGDDTLGGPVLVAIAGIATLIILAGPLRGSRGKAVEPMTRGRRETLAVAVAAGAVVFIAIAVLLFAVRKPGQMRLPPPTPVTAGSPQTVTLEAADPFQVNDLWPKEYELPGDLKIARPIAGEEVLVRAALPPGIRKDLEYFRGLEVENGKALMVGLQFRTQQRRQFWENNSGWESAKNTWSYLLSTNSQGFIIIVHDGSAHGEAANETLKALVNAKLSELRTGQKK